VKRIRFNIANLLVVVLFFGVGFAALRESNEIWDDGLFTLTIGLLLISILLAVHRSEAKRAFWIGFALFGWSYLALSVVPSIESRLLTTNALAYADSKLPGRTQSVFRVRFNRAGFGGAGNQVRGIAFSADGRQLLPGNLDTVRLWDATTGSSLSGWAGTTENFVRIGHSLVALMLSWFGGLLSRRLWRASRTRDYSMPVNDEGTNQ
jgi:hypothetical protein